MLVAATALAGCAEDSGPAPVDDDEQKFEDLDLRDGYGAIRGIVLDPAIVPIAGAAILLQGTQEVATSSEDGTFVFVDLEPGTYFMQISKLGYEPAQSSVTVEEGVERPDIVKVQLIPDPSTKPHVQYYSFEGLLQCSVNAVVGFNACGLVGDLSDQDFGESQVRYTIDGQPVYMQTEMVWDSTQPLGGGLSLLYSYGDCGGGFYCDYQVEGGSPLILGANMTKSQEILEGEEGELYIRVFGTESSNAQGSGAGATIEQRFTHYTSIFYGFEPQDGWSFIEDGPHELPS